MIHSVLSSSFFDGKKEEWFSFCGRQNGMDDSGKMKKTLAKGRTVAYNGGKW